MIPNPENETENLWSAATLIALKEVSITGKLTGRIADVTITQKYLNKNKNAKSVVFKFPFPEELGTVYNFSVKTDKNTVLKAEVKENKAAVIVDLQAALSAEFNSTEDTRELLVCRVVGLEPGKEVSISVSFVATAVVAEPEHLRFTLPTDLAFSLDDDEQPHDLNVKLEVEMPAEVKQIASPTHTLQSTMDIKDKTKAVCSCAHKEWTENEDLVIAISTPQATSCLFTPGWITKPNYVSYASFMLSFVPDLRSLSQIPNVDFVFLVDCSDLMAGDNRLHASAAVGEFLKRLPQSATFNLISVGTSDKRLFPKSVAAEAPSIAKASQWLKGLESDAINSISINSVLNSVLSAPLPIGTVGRQVVLITCGAIDDANTAMVTLREHVNKARLLVLGVAERASHHLLHSLARAGHGAAEILSGKESVEKKVERHVRRALQPRVADLRLDWGALEKLLKQPLLIAPAQMGHMYDSEPFVVFVFAELNDGASISKTEDYTINLRANTPSGPMVFPATLKYNSSHLPGVLIHKLASAAIIREAENNALALPAERLLLLSTFNSLSSTAASFVALAEKAADKPAATALLSWRFPPEIDEIEPEEEDRPVTPQPGSAPVAPAAAGPHGGKPAPMPMRPRSPLPADGVPRRLQYDADFLMSFQNMCTDRPADMPSFDSILSSTARKPTARSADRSGDKKGRAAGGFAGKGGERTGRGGRGAKAAAAAAPSGPLPTLRTAENRWQRPARAGESAAVESTLLKARGVLNKLTRDNFEPLALQLEEMSTSHADVLKGLIDRIFDKAVGEPKFCSMYAELCVRLNKHVMSKETPEGEQANPANSRFRRLLLGKCQQEFENKAAKPTAAAPATATAPTPAAATAATGAPATDAATAAAATPSPATTPSPAAASAEGAPTANGPAATTEATEPIATTGAAASAKKDDEDKKGNEAPLTPEELEAKHKRRVIGNIKFIGELFKLGMLKPAIMHECVATLLQGNQNSGIPDEGDLECLVQLLTTIGSSQDPQKKKFIRDDMTSTFEQIKALSTNRALPARMRFMLQDLLDLRANNWVARRKEAEPTTIAQLHQQAERDDKAKDAASRAALRSSAATPPPPREAPAPSPSPPIRSASRSPAPKEASRTARDEDGWETAKQGRKGGKDEWTGGPKGGRGSDRGGRGGDRGGRGGKDSGRGGRHEAPPAASRGSDRGGRGGSDRGGRGGKDRDRDTRGGKTEAPLAGNKFAAAAKAPAEMPSAPAAASGADKGARKEEKGSAVVMPTPTAPPRAAAASPALADVDFEAKFEQLLEEYLSSHDPEEAATCLKELQVDSLHPQFVQKAILSVLEKKESDRDLIATLLNGLNNAKVVSREQFAAGFSLVVEQLEDIEIDIPFASKFVAFFLGSALADSCMGADWLRNGLAPLVDSGKALKIAAEALQTFVKKRSDAALREMLAATPVDLLALSSPTKRNKQALAEFLKDKEPLGAIFA